MSRVLYLFAFTGFLTILFTLAFLLQPVSAAETVEHVILINAEGFNYEGYISTPMPNVKKMAAEGVIDEKSLSIRTESLEAAQASLLTGTLPEEHGYFNNSSNLEVESILALLQNNGRTFQVIDGSGGKLKVFNYGDEKYIGLDSNSTDEEAFKKAVEAIGEDMPFFTYIYVNDSMDKMLTLDEEAYYNSLKNFDDCLGNYFKKLKNEGMYYNSVIIVTSARSTSPSDLVPLLITGPNCKTGFMTSSTMVLDTVSTICRFIELKSPAASIGVPVYDAMIVDEVDEKYIYNKWVADLKRERSGQWSRYYESQDELYQTIHKMASMKEERQSIFDFAGEKEEIINKLRSRLSLERLFYLGLFMVMLAGYFVEYKWLKRKFLMFK